MIDLTQEEAQAIKSDVITRNHLIRYIEFNEIDYPGRDNNDERKEQISMLTDKIRRVGGIPPDQSLDDICAVVYYTLNLPDHNVDIRHITVDELPKVRIDKRNGYPNYYKKAVRRPGRITSKTRAKRMAALVKKMQNGVWDSTKREWTYFDDSITHIETGRVWNATTGATPEEFLEVMK